MHVSLKKEGGEGEGGSIDFFQNRNFFQEDVIYSLKNGFFVGCFFKIIIMIMTMVMVVVMTMVMVMIMIMIMIMIIIIIIITIIIIIIIWSFLTMKTQGLMPVK